MLSSADKLYDEVFFALFQQDLASGHNAKTPERFADRDQFACKPTRLTCSPFSRYSTVEMYQ